MTNIEQNIEDGDVVAPVSANDKKKKNKFAVKEEITEENCKFKDGEILKFVKVRFPGHAKSYPFLVGKRNLVYGQKVMAMSDRGMAVGYINSFTYEVEFKKSLLPLRSINKAASEEDIEKEKETYKKQKEIETTCQNLINKHNLDMNLTHVEFTQFGKKVVFYFVAPSRVDFRGLVKDLVSELRLRIELRQISVRDRAASQGALGPCGRELCCSSFLSKYGNVSIKMAKNQNLTLNYSKLNGVCGQLKCCLSYEDDVYSQKRKKLPNDGDFVKTRTGESGKVRKLNILNEQFDLLTDKGKIRRYTFNQVEKIYKQGEYQFPRHFDHISDETGNIIGLNDVEAKAKRQLDRDMEKIQKRAKKFAAGRVLELAEFFPERERTDLENELNAKIEVDPIPEEVETKTPNIQEPKTKDEETKSSNPKNDQKDGRGKKPYKKRHNKNYRNRNNRNNNKAKPTQKPNNAKKSD